VEMGGGIEVCACRDPKSGELLCLDRVCSEADVPDRISVDDLEYEHGAPDPSGVFEDCATGPVVSHFNSPGEYAAYLATAQGATGAEGLRGRTTIFPDLLNFSEAIEQALWYLADTPAGNRSHLSIYDFLSPYVLPCDEEGAAPRPACIDESQVRCGLALYQKALLSNWVSLDGVETSTDAGNLELFCVDTMPVAGCVTAGKDNPGLFTLQEHNRFWRDLGQIVKFDGDRARSDAFLTIYRHAANPFDQGAALSYKEQSLRAAFARYEQLSRLSVGTIEAAVLFNWPMRAFKQQGNDWLALMQTMMSDRMDVLAELTDLKRRVYLSSDKKDLIFAQHLMQHEYLAQVYLMVLQQHWQKEMFGYRGSAGPVFDKGQGVLSQLNPAKNPLGVTANRVYFENSDLALSNWQSYQAMLVGPDGSGGGMVGEAEVEIAAAIEELKSSLADLDAFEEKLFDSRAGIDAQIAEHCGNPAAAAMDAGGAAGYCAHLLEQYDPDEWRRLRDCKLEEDPEYDCPSDFGFTCSDYDNPVSGTNNCTEVVNTFLNATEEDSPACNLDSNKVFIWLHGERRACVGGAMGVLLQERARLQREAKTVIGSVESLATRFNLHFEKMAQASVEDDKLDKAKLGMSIAKQITEYALELTEAVQDGIKEATDAPSCVIIVGMAGGTDCPGHVTASLTNGIKEAVGGIVTATIKAGLAAMEYAGEVLTDEHDGAIEELDAGLELALLERDVDGLVSQFSLLVQEIFNVNAEIEDLRYQAQAAADGYQAYVTFVADHLTGRETGSVLVGDQLVARSAATFRRVLQYTYRMTMAFIHRYNLPAGQAASLVNQCQALLTLDDVKAFIAEIERREAEYCGAQGIDCDSSANTEVLRFSVREQLFPQLRDIVDGRTGEIVTAGQQFHNMITSPPYVRRRIRGANMAVDQIEIPFTIPLTLQENTRSGPRWMIDPLSCNHLLAGVDGDVITGGNIAVNVVGTNLGSGSDVVRYELVRGGTDFIRSCEAESVQQEIGTLPVLEFPIRKLLVGYAPQSTSAQADSPPSFVTRSGPLAACINQAETTGTLADSPACWRYFARDRSLSSTDWKLMLPLTIDGAATDNTWIVGDGLPEAKKPMVEDIVIYLRYHSRPLSE
ncbi:MAG: hypothetical protein V2A73_20640, partial [Pseudomonadota bacterium]